MIRAAREHGSRHGWIGDDALYGNNAAFTAELEDMCEVFLIDLSGQLWRVNQRNPCA